MLERLSKKEKDQLLQWRALWFSVGSSTEPAVRGDAEEAIAAIYESIGEKAPRFHWCLSPRDANETIKKLDPDISTPVYTCHLGQFDAYWVGYYLFCRDVLGVKYDEDANRKLELHAQVVRSSGWWYPFESHCFVCERPKNVFWKDLSTDTVIDSYPMDFDEHQIVVHRDGGFAVEFPDGSHVAALNGVWVPDWLATERDSDIDPRRIKELRNVEVRREFVRKVGIERVFQALGGELIDEETFHSETGAHHYQLVDLKVEKDGEWRYLKMENPSLEGTYVLEGVPQECQSVKDALNFRNGLSEEKIDDEAGAEWYQQGDVILRPRGRKKFKRFPKRLT